MSVVPKTLRVRVVVMLLIAFLVSAGAFIFAMDAIVTTSFQRVEDDAVLRDVARARSAIDAQVAELNAGGTVLANSSARTPGADALRALGIDAYVRTGPASSTGQLPILSGASTGGSALDPRTQAALAKLAGAAAPPIPGAATSGLALLPDGPAEVSAKATGDATGQRIVVVRYLGPDEAAAIGALLHTSIAFTDPTVPHDGAIPTSAYTAQGPGNAGVVALDSATNLGWVSLAGLDGTTALVLSLTEPRPITAQAAAILGYTQWGVSLLSLLVGLNIVVMLEGSVLHRLARLRDSVIDYPQDTASLSPVVAEGADEISDLANAVNATLGRIKASEEAHKHDARHDHLTGLANRRCLAENVEPALQRSAAAGAKCTLVLLDLDDFKHINGELGHQVGDEVLVWFGERMRSCLRVNSILCRLGGDEFAVLMPATTRREAEFAVERLRLETSRPEDNPCFGMADVSFSVGYAVYPDHGETLEMLMQCADTDLYANKRGKADEFEIAPEPA